MTNTAWYYVTNKEIQGKRNTSIKFIIFYGDDPVTMAAGQENTFLMKHTEIQCQLPYYFGPIESKYRTGLF